MTRSIARDARGLSAADELRVFISSQKSDESGVRRDVAIMSFRRLVLLS